MNLVETIKNFNINNIFLLDPVKNTVINNSSFIRILYSNNLLTLNGIYLCINLKNAYILPNHHKVKYMINLNDNVELIKFLKNLEYSLLNLVEIKKKKIYKLSEQIQNGLIKIVNNNYNNSNNHNNYNNYILKISGIWESNTEYGLTYKFIDIFNII